MQASVSLTDQGGGKRRASTISYSSLNSLRVMDRSRAVSGTPLCANSMILDATKRVAGSSLSLKPNSAHTVSNASDMLRIASGFESCPVEKWTNRHCRPSG
jgi:hypothetical protein